MMRSQQGYLLISVVITLFIIAAAVLMMNEESAMESHMLSAETDTLQLKYLSEAAEQHAQWSLQQQGCGPFSDLASQSLAGGSYNATITPNNAGGVITSYQVAVSDDAYIDKNNSTTNYGGNAQLDTYWTFWPSANKRALYRFDIAGAGLPTGANIVSAVAKIFVIDPHSAANVEVHQIIADWTEGSVNWSNINGSIDSSSIASIPQNSATGQYVDVNITSLVQGWVNGSIANQGIMLKINFSLSSDLTQFSSKEYGNINQRPYLEIKVSSNLSNRADMNATAVAASGASKTITRNNIPLYTIATKNLSLQPDAASGKDAEIWNQASKQNYGNATETWVSSASNDTSRTMLGFNLQSIPLGAKIHAASLSLLRWSGSGSNQPVSAHRVKNAWSEAKVSWNSREAGINWDNPGGDYDDTAIATTPVGPANKRYEWDIASLVQDWVNNLYPNHGIELTGAVPGMAGERFYTSDDSDSTRRPKLTISYSCECGIVCQAPSGSGRVLLAVGDATTLDAGDLKKKALFERWGYSVSLIDDDASQSAFDTAITNNDTAYISESVNSWTLADKLTNARIGVVNEEGALNSKLGFSSSYGNSTGSNLSIVDNTHYITALFGLQSLPIYDAKMDGLNASGTLAAGLQKLADWNGVAGLAVIDSGGLLADGSSTAAGARVMLPIGRKNQFNWGYLNNNGRLIVQRSIQWAIDATPYVPPAKKIYWTDDDGEVIQRADEDGSNVETVISDQPKVRGLDIDTVNGKIYWSSGSSIRRADLDGSNLEVIYNNILVTNFDVKLDVEAGKMVWTFDNLLNQIKRANLDGSSVETLNDAMNMPMYFSLDIANSQLYATAFGNGDIMRMNFDGSGLATLIDGADNGIIGSAIDTVHGKVYWSGGASNDWIKRADLDGSNIETIITGMNAPQDIVVDSDNDRIYFTEALVTPSIRRANSDGSNLETIVSGLNRPRGIIIVNADQVPAAQPFSCDGIYRDEFETASYSNNNGTLNWNSDWIETNESDGPTSGDERIQSDTGHNSLRIRDNDGGGEGVEREANLSGASAATLSLLYRRKKLDNSNDRVTLSISSNGAAGPWTELGVFAGAGTDNNYVAYSKDITSYISATTRIRLLTSSTMGGKDEVFFDDIQIECHP